MKTIVWVNVAWGIILLGFSVFYLVDGNYGDLVGMRARSPRNRRWPIGLQKRTG